MTRLTGTMMILCALILVLKEDSNRLMAAEYSSQQIADHIEDELMMDEAVSAARIDITVNDGIATLSGTTSNLLEKDRAQRIAEAVKGVRAVINRINIHSPELRTDKEIEQAIEQAWLADAATQAYQVSVKASGGVATLAGKVDSWQEQQLAAKVAKGVSGVRSVKNNITVDYKLDRTDAEVKNEITAALNWNIFVDDTLIDVHVDNGVVTLSGTVGSATEKSKAERIAWVAGVSSVNSQELEVAGWTRDPKMRKDKYASKTSEEIQDAIDDALLQDPRVFIFNVEPEVTGSLVTLRGTVTSFKAKQAAEQVARGTAGVTSVTNRIKVRTGEIKSDEEIETSIRNALVNDPYVDRFEITVDVINGVAHLHGDVDTHFEKMQAEDKAARVYGVAYVNNLLEVDAAADYVFDPYVDEDYPEDYFDAYEPQDFGVTKTDAEIKEEIADEIFWSPFVDSDGIEVSVENGVAILTGNVESWAESKAAAENAHEGGAARVINNLVINQ